MPERAVLVACAAAAVAFGCTRAPSGRAVLAPDRHPLEPATALITPARVFAVGDANSTMFSAQDADGARRSIVDGMRLVEHADGSVERAAELLPPGQAIRPLELPRRLGGGYLFFAGNGNTSLWRSKTWTGKLSPLVEMDFDVAQVIPGFDRLYLIGRTSSTITAVDARTGATMDLGSLPPAPAYGSLAFADEWMGAVDVPLRGVLATFDAGASWRPVGNQDTYGVALEDGQIVLFTSSGKFALDESGVLEQTDKGGGDESLFRGAGQAPATTPWVQEAPDAADQATLAPPGPLGRKPLVAAVLHGYPDSRTTAVVADNGALARVRVADGKILDVAPHALPADATCQGVRVEHTFGFVCGREHGATVVYAFKPPLGLSPVLTFDGPRYVAASGNGALVARGSCPGGNDRDAYCILDRDGQTREIRVKGDLGVERVVALSDGRTAVIVPPRLGAPGALLLIAKDGTTRSVALTLPKIDGPTLSLVKKGLWLDGFVERRPGELAGWVVAGGPFAGLRVGPDGTVKIGGIEHDIEHTLISGPLALSMGSSGLARESIDGGFEWRKVQVAVDTGATRTDDGSGGLRGCSRVGCTSATWLRVGWSGSPKDDETLHVVQAPPQAPIDVGGGGRWSLSCRPTGESGGLAALPVRAAPVRPPPTPYYYGPMGYGPPPSPTPDTVQSTAWTPFRGVQAPRRGSDDVGFDTGPDDDSVHGYIWGARGASWDRVGNMLLYASDPYSVKDGVWSTAITRSPWQDVVTASQVFGAPDSGMPSSWRVVLDPSSHAGLLLINARGTQELFAFEEGRSVSRIEDVASYGIAEFAGAVRLGQTWYVGGHAQNEQSFRILRVEGNHLAPFGEYPDRLELESRSAVGLQLVKNQRGDALGIWATARQLRGTVTGVYVTSWYVYPIDMESRHAGAPLELSPRTIANARACDSGDDGWLLEGNPAVQPPYIDLSRDADDVRATNARARMLAGARGLCIEALSADREGAGTAIHGSASTLASWAAGRATFELTLAARPPDGRRWAFRCLR